MADLAHASEGDTDLHGDPDASHWAERFAARFVVLRRLSPEAPGVPLVTSGVDTEDLMLAWFAGAIETGRMLGR
jgi:hypothetical protein